MTKSWDGRERRTPTSDGREGRRPGDRHCAQHEILWDHHEKDKDAYRVLTCGKIKKINAEIDKMISWKIFAFLFTFSVLVVGAGFGFFGSKIEKLSDRQEASMDSLQAIVSGMASTQSVMMVKITEIEKRNDRIDGKNTKQ
jgi:cation transport ATPase